MNTVTHIIEQLKQSQFMLSLVKALNTMLILMALEYTDFWNNIKK